jgi:phosphoesterase RecJ-like protein
VAELTAAGADPQVIGTDTYMNNTLNGTRLLGHLLSTFELNEEKTLAWCIITAQKRQEHGADIEDTSSVVNHLLAITGVEVAMIFEVEEGMIHLSMRSKTDFDVGVITREIGGGGHLNAAGAAIKGGIPHCRKMISIVNKKLKEHFATH